MNNLINKINHWADERNLKQADPKIQWMRVTEEVGEIRDVLSETDEIHGTTSSVKRRYRGHASNDYRASTSIRP